MSYTFGSSKLTAPERRYCLKAAKSLLTADLSITSPVLQAQRIIPSAFFRNLVSRHMQEYPAAERVDRLTDIVMILITDGIMEPVRSIELEDLTGKHCTGMFAYMRVLDLSKLEPTQSTDLPPQDEAQSNYQAAEGSVMEAA